YCGAFPRRLGGVILAGSRDVAGSLAEMRRWCGAGWAWGVLVYAPFGVPLDHPDLEPIYAAAAELGLAIVLHTFTVMPPYVPGGACLGDEVLMYASDSPHGESHFPQSAGIVRGWDMPDNRKQKLLWDNANPPLRSRRPRLTDRVNRGWQGHARRAPRGGFRAD